MPQHEQPKIAAAAIVVAAGKGERFGAPDKVFLPVGGRPLLAHVLSALEQATSVRDVVLVIGEHTRATLVDLVAEGGWTKVRSLVSGGQRRQDSVAAGLATLAPDVEIVVIHDGARPLAPASLFDSCVSAANVHGA